MKKLYPLITGLLLVISVAIILHSCKKSNSDSSSDSGCVVGGFDAASTYVFYQSKDYGNGPFTIKIKDSNGNNVTLERNVTSVYESATPTNGCGDAYASKRAEAYLLKGKNYTYTASDGTRGWAGSISVPCSPTMTCNPIKIDQ